ncbi:MAG: hypothetical protein HN601_02610 [Candidatus Marinimicrobia bacterium]|jgi:spore coat polysaccharide biosynthesis predicted glycosyltransferase SpsG|nr:hypothetical protein [Candidatus Neomarinimicrobiota bacterium]
MKNFPEGVKVVTSSGFVTKLLHPEISVQKEASALVTFALDKNAIVFFDLRSSINHLLFNAVKNKILTIIYEDVCTEDTEPTLVINPNPQAFEETSYLPEIKKTKYCLGTDYVVIDPKISKYQRSHFSSRVNRLFLCFGGADPCNISYRVLNLIISAPFSFQIDLILGPAYKYSNKIKSLITDAKNGKQVTVVTNCNDLAPIQSRCDAAITSGGTIVYESIALRVPTLVLPTIDHEVTNTTPLRDRCLVSSINQDVNTIEDVKLHNIILNFINNAEIREKHFKAQQFLNINGGAQRVSDQICKLFQC